MTSTSDPQLAVRSPADLIAAVPYLLGFHPADSVALVAMRGTRVTFAARYDLPAPEDPPPVVDAQARHAAGVVARQDVDAVTVIGYGPAARVTRPVRTLAAALAGAGMAVLDELRVTDGRFWSYLCQELSCCPAEGTACHSETSVVAAAATFAGQVALPDRAALAAQLAPVDGPVRVAMRSATRAARERRQALVSGAPGADGSGRPALRRAGEAAVRAAMRRHSDGGLLTDDEVAWLSVLLTDLPVRDRAWELIGDERWHVGLWRDVVRRAEPEYVVAPACLLAFAAWRAGHGALAGVALDRARREDAGYSMAVLLQEVLQHGLPPSTLAGWAGDRPARRPRRPRRRDLRT